MNFGQRHTSNPPLQMNAARPILANSSPEILLKITSPHGILSVKWIEQIDAHGLFLQREGEMLLATHNNGFSCYALGKALAEGDHQKATRQLDYIKACGGTGASKQTLANILQSASPHPVPCPVPDKV